MINFTGKPYLIAEVGVAHFGSFEKASQFLDVALEAKCDAFKLQVFDIDTLFANDANGWKKRLKDRVLKIDEIKNLSDKCKDNNIDFIITPHDESIFPYLELIQVNALKIGSGEVGNTDFISKCFDFADHVIYSTGLSKLEDIDQVYKISKKKGKKLSILHCNTSYPTDDKDVNLSVIPKFISRYPESLIGYSDHTVDHLACLNAVSLGAKIIERHITLEKNIPNAQDWKVSSLPDELKDLRRNLDRTYLQLGKEHKIVTTSAKNNIYWACKSPYLRTTVEKGKLLSRDLIVMKRPFTGTKMQDIIFDDFNCYLKKDIQKDESISVDDIYISPKE